jgi:hypothetical protein
MMEMPYIKPDGIEEVWARELARSREIFQEEMRNVLSCQTKKERKELYDKWKATYTEGMVRDLVKCAQDKTYRVVIANGNEKRRK